LHELQIWAHGSAARTFIGERPIEPEDFLPLKQAGVFADNGVISDAAVWPKGTQAAGI
jgi:hypothetical protein